MFCLWNVLYLKCNIYEMSHHLQSTYYFSMEIKTERRPRKGDQTSSRVKVEYGSDPGSRLNPGSDVSIFKERGSFDFKDVSNIKPDKQPAQVDTVEVKPSDSRDQKHNSYYFAHLCSSNKDPFHLDLFFFLFRSIKSNHTLRKRYLGCLRHPSYGAQVLPTFRGFSLIFNQLFQNYFWISDCFMFPFMLNRFQGCTQIGRFKR